ncbi:MAG: hypothetical protein ACLUL2_15480 [Blautia sp.]
MEEDHQVEVLHRAENHQEADIPQDVVILQEEAPTPATDTEPASIISPNEQASYMSDAEIGQMRKIENEK